MAKNYNGLSKIKYQERIATDLGKQAILNKNLFKEDGKCREIVFKAPTGAGKTATEFLYKENIFKEDPNGILVHITIGKGELHLQTQKRFKEYSNGGNRIYSTREIPSVKKVKPHDVFCINWESLNKTDKKTGQIISTLAKEYHESQTTFPMLCEMIKSQELNVYLVIDEDHESSQTNKSQEIISKLNPVVKICQSATSKGTPSTQADFFEVSREEVIDEELIVYGFIMQKGLEKVGEVTRDLILKGAFETREFLVQEAKKEGITYNPLIGIQIANGALGEEQKKEVIEVCRKQGMTEENGQLVLFLSEEKSEDILLKNIDDNDSPVKVLIYKQAVATGWDCPRAKIWVKLRDIKSTSFSQQSGGRYFRTVFRKHFKNPLLNYAYMFTDEEEYKYDPEIFKNENPQNRDLKITLEAEFEKLIEDYTLVSEYSSREGNYGDYKADIHEHVFSKWIKSNRLLKTDIKGNVDKLKVRGYIFTNKAERSMVGTSEIKIEDFLDRKEIFDNEKLVYQMSEEEVTLKLKNKFFQDMKHDFSLERSWRAVLSSWRRISVLLFEDEPIFKFYKFLLNNKNWELFVKDTEKSMEKYRNHRKEQSKGNHEEVRELKISKERTYNSHSNEIKRVNKGAYKILDQETNKLISCCVFNSQDPQTEANFYSVWNEFSGGLPGNLRIHRNGKNTENDLRITYQQPTSKKMLGFHPDILLIEAIEKGWYSTGIFDIKHSNEVKNFNENSDEVAKHNAQIDYMKRNSTPNNSLYGGMIVQFNGSNGLISFKVFEGLLDLKAFNKGDFSSGKDLEDYIKEKINSNNQKKVA